MIAIRSFERQLGALSKRHRSIMQDLAELAADIETDRYSGTPIKFGCYKVRQRVNSKGRGKSSRARVIATVFVSEGTLYLLDIYGRSARTSIGDAELWAMLAGLDGERANRHSS